MGRLSNVHTCHLTCITTHEWQSFHWKELCKLLAILMPTYFRRILHAKKNLFYLELPWWSALELNFLRDMLNSWPNLNDWIYSLWIIHSVVSCFYLNRCCRACSREKKNTFPSFAFICCCASNNSSARKLLHSLHSYVCECGVYICYTESSKMESKCVCIPTKCLYKIWGECWLEWFVIIT